MTLNYLLKDIDLALFLRIVATLIRTIIPISIIWLSSGENLGIYYLSISILTFGATLAGLDLGLFFSSKYIRENLKGKRRVFNLFLKQGLRINLIAIILGLVGLFILSYLPFPTFLILVPLLITAESLSLEFGKFYRNLGFVLYASFRDLIRSIILALTIFFSLLFFDTILVFETLCVYILCLFSLVIFESASFGIIKKIIVSDFFVPKSILSSTKDLFLISGPQFVQNQINNLIMVLERTFLSVTLGLDIQGIYSFFWSFVSVISSLFSFPYIAKNYQSLIKDIPNFSQIKTYKSVIKLFFQLFALVLLLTIVCFVSEPVAKYFFNQFSYSFYFLFAAVGLSVLANTYISASGPIFGQIKFFWFSNILTLLIALPYFCIPMIYNSSLEIELHFNSVMLLITIVSILELILRIRFFYKQIFILQKA